MYWIHKSLGYIENNIFEFVFKERKPRNIKNVDFALLS